MCKIKYEFKNKKKFIKIDNANPKDNNQYINEIKNNDKVFNINEKEFSYLLYEIKNGKFRIFNDYIYYLDYVIGAGGQMKTFFGKNMKKNEYTAIKIETKKKKMSPIKNEAIILSKLKGIEGIPFVLDYSYKDDKNILCESLYGPSLIKIHNFIEEEFEITTISVIGIQIMNILKSIHEKLIIHNDVKPNNICWGKFLKGILEKKNQFFLIDFGYARDISSNLNLFLKKNKKEVFDLCHYEDKNEKKFQGTPQFMGIQIGKGYRPSRRTDIEELIYSLI